MTNDTLTYIKQSQIRAAFVIGTILTCGFAGIPWIIWEIFKKRN